MESKCILFNHGTLTEQLGVKDPTHKEQISQANNWLKNFFNNEVKKLFITAS